ncbi:MAG: hypothetical protein KDK38_08950 [Leptospiraceae bacterium]|nr:hypothetical protein [Leptospiraceae bacterium]
MKILINGEELQFTLEKENSLKEILDSVASWAETNALYIVDYTVESKEPPEKQNSQNIDVLDILLGTRDQLVVSQLTELDAYVNRMGAFLAERYSSGNDLTEAESVHLADGMQYIRESLAALEAHLPRAGEELEGALISLKNSNEPVQKISALAIIKNRTSLWLRQTEFALLSDEERKGKREEFFQYLDGVDTQLETVASEITMGKEQMALGRLTEILEQFSTGLAILGGDPGGSGIVNDLGDFVKLLGELAAALDSGDMVTAADIVDFDLRDGIEKLRALR